MQKKSDLVENRVSKFLWILIVGYIVYFSIICFLKFSSFAYDDFDLAIHDQVLWNILHGSIFSSILGIDFLGNHAHLILFLVAPFYKIFPHPFTLLFLQTIALGIGALPLYLLSRSILGYKWALAISFMYLIYPALGYVNLFEFHPTVFATFFLFFMLYYFYKEKFSLFLLFMILTMLCQENISLVIIMMGFYGLVKRKKPKWVILPMVIGGLYFWLIVTKFMPYFNKDTIQFIAIYSHLGDSFSKIIINILTHPIEIIKIMFTKQKIIYLTQLFGPLSFIPLLSPLSLLLLLPFFMQHLLSLRITEVTIYYHYTAEMIPFIFLALIYGIKNLLALDWLKKRQFLLIMPLLLVSLGYNFYLGPHFRLFKQIGSVFKKDELDRQKEALLKKIPRDAAVVATFEFFPHLTHRKQLYSFHHVYMGFYTLSNQPYNLPDTVEYALLDFNDLLTFRDFYNSQRYQNIRQFLSSGDWGVSDVKDTMVLFQKNTQDKYRLYYVLLEEPQPENKTSLIIDRDIELLGYDLKERKDNLLHIVFYWRLLNKTDKDINVFFDLIDSEGRLIFRLLRPICYRIYPTQAWQAGQFISEERYLIFPSNLFPGQYLFKLGFFNYGTGELIRVNSYDPLGRIDIIKIKK